MSAILPPILAGVIAATTPFAVPTPAQRGMHVLGGSTSSLGISGPASLYFPLGGKQATSPVPTQAQAETPMRQAGVLFGLGGYVDTNTRTSATSIRVLVNGAPVLTITWAAVTGGWATPDLTEVPYVSGDLVCIEYLFGAGTGQFITGHTSFGDRQAGQVAMPRTSFGSNSGSAARSLTAFGLPESLGELVALEACTLDHMLTRVATSAAVVDFTIAAWKNGAATGMTQANTYTGGAADTTFHEDTTHSDALAAGDTFSVRVPSTGAASIAVTRLGYRYRGSTAGAVLMAGMGSVTAAAGNTYYGAPGGSASTSSSSATHGEARVPFAARASKLKARSGGTFAGGSTVTIELMKNGIATGHLVTISAASTASADDASTTDYAAGDTIGWRIYGQAGSCQIQWVEFLLTDLNAVV